MQLNPNQLRVLGSLIEKEITTPEAYPLSLNALLNACNQRSSRDPVLDLDEEEVRQALNALQELGLTAPNRDARVTKYEHRARTVLNLRRDETALLCLLILRGPQTPGELRSRADRMFSFDDLAGVTSALDRLAGRPERIPSAPESPAALDPNTTGPLVILLPRRPGSREARYGHLLGDPHTHTALLDNPAAEDTVSTPAAAKRIEELESAIASLQHLLAAMEARVSALESNVVQPTKPVS